MHFFYIAKKLFVKSCFQSLKLFCKFCRKLFKATMGIKTYNPYTPSRRNMTGSDFSEITKTTPEKSLCTSLKKNAGRNNQGKITYT